MINRLQLALGGGVETGLVNIHYVLTWTANQSGLVALTFDPESGVRVTSDVGYLFLGLSVLDLDLMYATDVRQKRRLMPPPIRGGA